LSAEEELEKINRQEQAKKMVNNFVQVKDIELPKEDDDGDSKYSEDSYLEFN
jgi:hypothetical protein